MNTIKLGDVATYINGYAFKPSDWCEEGLPIIRIQDLTGTSYQTNYYNGNYPKKVEINKGDVLISWSASLGVYIWNNEKALLNQHIFKVVFDKVEINKKYFVYAVKYNLNNMVSKMHGATMKHIVKKDFDNIKIPFLNLDEQQNIVKILNSIEKIIAARKQQLKQLDLLIKARFVEMFGDYNLSNIQPDWVTISSVGKVVGGSTPKTTIAEYWNGEYRWITPAELADDSGYIYDSERKITRLAIEKSALKELPKDTVLLTSRAPIGKVAIAGKSFYCNQGFKNIICNDKILPRYLYTLLLFNSNYLNSLGRGATFKEISKNIVENILIPLPSIDLQNEFADFVAQVDKSKFYKLNSIYKILKERVCYYAEF